MLSRKKRLKVFFKATFDCPIFEESSLEKPQCPISQISKNFVRKKSLEEENCNLPPIRKSLEVEISTIIRQQQGMLGSS